MSDRCLVVEKIETLGGEAEGEVRPDEPLEAVAAVLESADGFEQIIISTLPARLSRWLKMDLPSRVSRMTSVPVIPDASGPAAKVSARTGLPATPPV